MAAESIGISLGSQAPAFDLAVSNPWIDQINGPSRSLSHYPGPLAVIFTCNHCPYAVHIESVLAQVAQEYLPKGIHFVAINANDSERYPDDSFDKMAIRAKEVPFPFPYLYDESQEVAKAYKAACTPDLFVFDTKHKLVYSGRFDETRPGKGVAHGLDFKKALDSVLDSDSTLSLQLPSIGCSIKWKPGNAPEYS